FLWSGVAGGAARVFALLLAAASIQMRLVCNLLDGMVAVEHDQGSPVGPVWNELPDRIADTLFLASAGYAASLAGAHGGWPGGVAAGWICAVGAVTTAYVRELGRGLGLAADFSGPMAKPHRMAALTAAAVVPVFE